MGNVLTEVGGGFICMHLCQGGLYKAGNRLLFLLVQS